MNTALKTEQEKKEYFDSPQVLSEKVSILVEMIKNSKHFVAFTGAGISTSTGIPDFRSGINTVLKTGPGAWEKMAQKIPNQKAAVKVGMHKAIPSLTHMSLVELNNQGILKFLISQNVDGLHRRSGFNPACLAELHGNTNLEKCKKCGKKYLRDFRVRNALQVHDHDTGRKCENPKCKGDLIDSIINFGENLPEKDLDDGFVHSQISDLHIVLGSSLRVTPAADMPAKTAELGKNLVIINLQKTPLDGIATLRINAMCDDVMKMVMERLGIKVPEFVLERRIVVSRVKNQVSIVGEDVDGSPYEIFKQVALDQGKNLPIKIEPKAPFTFNVTNESFAFKLAFHEHYNEPHYRLDLKLSEILNDKKLTFKLKYSLQTGEWTNCTRE